MLTLEVGAHDVLAKGPFFSDPFSKFFFLLLVGSFDSSSPHPLSSVNETGVFLLGT